MLYFDSAFVQGYSHTVCEDYSIHNGSDEDHIKIAVISDGCSGSEFTDVGSRILCLQAISRKEELEISNPQEFGRHVAQSSSIVLDLLGFSNTLPLFATLGFVGNFGFEKRIQGALLGDGAIIFKLDGILNIIKVDYDGNMPYYPAYDINAAYEQGYAQKTEEFPNKNQSRTVVRLVLNDQTKELETVNSYRTDFHIPLSISVVPTDLIEQSQVYLINEGSFEIQIPNNQLALEFLFVASDGIFSFVEEKGREQTLSENEILSLVVQEISKIQPTAGGFLQRRIRKMKTTLKSLYGLDHYDDLSIAGVMTEKKS